MSTSTRTKRTDGPQLSQPNPKRSHQKINDAEEEESFEPLKKLSLFDQQDSDSDQEPDILVTKSLQSRKKKQLVASDAQDEQDEQLELNIQTKRADQQQLSNFSTFDLEEIHNTIKQTSDILCNFKELRDPKVSRRDYLNILSQNLQRYYGYNDFIMIKLLQLFSVPHTLEFLAACEQARPLTIRVNTLKTRRRDVGEALIAKGVDLDPIKKWSSVGLIIYEPNVPIGSTTEYLAGHYMLQGAASFLPVMALDPKPDETVLDLAAAPGGKTTYIAQLMRNTGLLWANDASRERCKKLVANIHRMGVLNSIVSNYDGKAFPAVSGTFHRVLLDAPCTGLGVISRDRSIKMRRTHDEMDRCTNLQKELLLAAIDSTKPKSHSCPGVIVYSTCSVAVEENESIVEYCLKRRHVKIVDTGLIFGVNGFNKYRKHRYHPSMSLAKRFYPHLHNLDGFFVCKIVKLSDKKIDVRKRKPWEVDEVDEVDEEEGVEKGVEEVDDQEKPVVNDVGNKPQASTVKDTPPSGSGDQETVTTETGTTTESTTSSKQLTTTKVKPQDEQKHKKSKKSNSFNKNTKTLKSNKKPLRKSKRKSTK